MPATALSSAGPSILAATAPILLRRGRERRRGDVWYSSFNGSVWAPQQRLAVRLDVGAPAITTLDGYRPCRLITWTDGNDTINYS